MFLLVTFPLRKHEQCYIFNFPAKMSLPRSILLLSCIIIIIAPTHCLVDTSTQKANAKYLMKWKQFEMAEGGTAAVSIDFNPSVILPLRLYICSSEEIKRLLQKYDSIEQICSDFNSTGGCRATLDANDGGLLRTLDSDLPLRSSWVATMSTDVMLEFYYLNCNSHQAEFVVTYALVNPNGEQVGLGQIPLRAIYLVCSMVWVGILGIMLLVLYVWYFTRRTQINGLHIALIVVALIAVIASLSSYNYWSDYSLRGKPDAGNSTFMNLGNGMFIISILLVALLVSKGWKVVDAFHGSVAGKDWRTIGLLFLVYGFTFAFYSVYGGSFFPLFMLVMCFFILIRYVHRGIKLNLFVLRHQLTIMGAVLGLNPRGSPVLHQFEAMVRLLNVLPGLLVLHLLCRLWDMTTSIHNQPEWVAVLAGNVWCFVVVIFLFINFRAYGAQKWIPRSLIDETAAAASIQNSTVSGDVESRVDAAVGLPKSKPEAFEKAVFMIYTEDHHEMKMTTHLRTNPRCLTLATEPWCVTPGTIIMDMDNGGDREEIIHVTAEAEDFEEEIYHAPWSTQGETKTEIDI